MKALSIVIPFFDSTSVLQNFLPRILEKINRHSMVELILADSTGRTDVKAICDELGVEYIYSERKGRAVQMNIGADRASGMWLFFLHIDSIPPDGFDLLITDGHGFESGCFQLEFDYQHWFLKFFAFFTRFSWPLARGGDQGLFVKREVFFELKGYGDIPIMEDIDICRRLIRRKSFVILPQKIITSARKYRQYGVYRLQLIFGWLTFLYWIGIDANRLKQVYDKNISI